MLSQEVFVHTPKVAHDLEEAIFESHFNRLQVTLVADVDEGRVIVLEIRSNQPTSSYIQIGKQQPATLGREAAQPGPTHRLPGKSQRQTMAKRISKNPIQPSPGQNLRATSSYASQGQPAPGKSQPGGLAKKMPASRLAKKMPRKW